MKSGMRIFLVIGLCLVAGIFVAGCTQQTTSVPTTTAAAATTAQTPAAGVTTAAPEMIANPASVNCVNLSGTVEIKKDTTGGEYGMCTFANGTTCEEWALFRGEGCKAFAGPAANATIGTCVGLPIPASVNCVNLNGTVEIKKNATGGEYGMCTFANGTACEEWALFRGEGCKAGV